MDRFLTKNLRYNLINDVVESALKFDSNYSLAITIRDL